MNFYRGSIHVFLLISFCLATACQAENEKTNPVEVRARAALSAILNAPADSFTLVDIHAKNWSDSSLGCPEPGMMYMQVIIPGHSVTLAHQYLPHQQRNYAVHLGPRRAVVCGTPEVAAPDGILPTPEQ